jgi:hypothetical protein
LRQLGAEERESVACCVYRWEEGRRLLGDFFCLKASLVDLLQFSGQRYNALAQARELLLEERYTLGL